MYVRISSYGAQVRLQEQKLLDSMEQFKILLQNEVKKYCATYVIIYVRTYMHICTYLKDFVWEDQGVRVCYN